MLFKIIMYKLNNSIDIAFRPNIHVINFAITSRLSDQQWSIQLVTIGYLDSRRADKLLVINVIHCAIMEIIPSEWHAVFPAQPGGGEQGG